jgi:Protein of unknown function (DUF3078)
MKKTAIIILTFSFLSKSYSQEVKLSTTSKWKRKFQTGVNVNQASFSDNWKGGGVNSLSWTALLNFRADYSSGTFDWTNDFQSIYGTQTNSTQGNRKNADRIFFETKISRKISKSWRLFASATFMSQFDIGYDYKKDVAGKDSTIKISSLMSPGYLTEAAGFEYKPVDYFSAQLGIGALRQTFVTDQSLYTGTVTSLYGVDKGQNVRYQAVFQFVANFEKEVVKNITIKARYLGIADYQKLNSEGFVHRLDFNIIAKVNRYINTSIGTVVLYDFDQDSKVQFSQVLNIGILYSLQNFKEEK